MTRNFSLFLLFLLGFSCSRDRFTIEGSVTEPLFLGEKVYLVALDGPVSRQVDSTLVKEGSFSFSLKADTMEVRIIRIAPKFPATIQDLVVIAEKGTLTATLGTVSRGGGTPLNDRLQRWKDNKELHDSTLWQIYRKKETPGLSPAAGDSLTAMADSVRQRFRTFNVGYLEQNLHNGIGLLLFKLYFHSLTADEKNRVMQQTGDLYFRHDAELRQRMNLPPQP